MTRTTALLAAAVLLSCASAPLPKQSWDGAPTTAGDPPAAAGPREPGAAEPPPALSKADACEASARRLLSSVPDKAWAALKACVERSRFTSLERLLDGNWSEELRRRNDAVLLIGRMVAARGGDTMGDLAALRQARVPVFGLEPAMANPELYKGRVLIFRARVDDIKVLPGNKGTVRMAQVELSGRARFVDTGLGYRSSSLSSYSGSASVRGSGSGSYNGSRGSGKFSGSASARSTELEESSGTLELRRFKNGVDDTGRIAVAKMAALDPFLEPGKDFVVVGRFDGVRQEASRDMEQPDANAVVSLYGYFEPSGALME